MYLYHGRKYINSEAASRSCVWIDSYARDSGCVEAADGHSSPWRTWIWWLLCTKIQDGTHKVSIRRSRSFIIWNMYSVIKHLYYKNSVGMKFIFKRQNKSVLLWLHFLYVPAYVSAFIHMPAYVHTYIPWIKKFARMTVGCWVSHNSDVMQCSAVNKACVSAGSKHKNVYIM